MNKTAYMRGFIKWFKSQPHPKTTLAIGLPAIGLSMYGAHKLGNQYLVPASNAVQSARNIAQDSAGMQKLFSQGKQLADQDIPAFVQKTRKDVDQLGRQLRDTVALAKRKINDFDIHTIGKYALGGAGIIGGSILLSNLLSAPKKKRKKDQDQEQED